MTLLEELDDIGCEDPSLLELELEDRTLDDGLLLELGNDDSLLELVSTDDEDSILELSISLDKALEETISLDDAISSEEATLKDDVPSFAHDAINKDDNKPNSLTTLFAISIL